MVRSNSIGATLALILSAVSAVAGQERLDIRLKAQRWQPLPPEVRRVYVGPDKRTWYELASSVSPVLEVDAIKKAIEREFRQESPQIRGARLALFEPGGRVWFTTLMQDRLLGYDGMDWIEVPPKARKHFYFDGDCLSAGEIGGPGANRSAGGVSWFVAPDGIYRFDGKDWLYQVLAEHEYGRGLVPQLAISPDGQTAVGIIHDPFRLWVCRGKIWKKYVFPRELKKAGIDYFGLSDADTLWCIVEPYKTLLRLDVDEPLEIAARIENLILQLGDDSYDTRERATKALADLGEVVRPYLERALKNGQDPEVRSRLTWAAGHLEPSPLFTPLGDVAVKKPLSLRQDGQGNIYVFAEQMKHDGRDRGAGLAILRPDGRSQVLPGAGETLVNYTQWRMIAAPQPGRSWLIDRYSKEPARLLDLEVHQCIDALPDSRFYGLQAVDADGRVYAARDSGFSTDPPVMVYTPGAPDDRLQIVATETTAADNCTLAVGDDGTLWRVDWQRLVRFDGQFWQVIGGGEGAGTPVLLGMHGAVVARSRAGFVLIDGQERYEHADLPDLIEKRLEIIRRCFGPSHSGGPRGDSAPSYDMAADQAGNVWLRNTDSTLQVFDGNIWHDMAYAGSRSVRVSYLCAVGSGKQVFVTVSEKAGRSSYLCRLADGAATLTPVPAARDYGDFGTVRDQDGALWIRHTRSANPDDKQRVTYRIGDQGILEQHVGIGAACLADQAGTVWFSDAWEARRSPETRRPCFKLWRAGRIVQEMEIPHANYHSKFFSDAPGSVWVTTPLGLQHLIADGPGYERFRLGRSYAIDRFGGSIEQAVYSSKGYAALLVESERGRRGYSLHLVKLPRERDCGSEDTK